MVTTLPFTPSPASLPPCRRSPWFPASSWRLFRHLTLVDTPNIWYLPLAYAMGDWAPEAGDTLICEAWECDDGCDPANPALLPDPALDDYIGQAILTMGAFRVSWGGAVGDRL